jgi:uncharacterized protein (UPF0332 family)
MPVSDDILMEKAVAALAGAESELAAGRYDNVANRCYYACFQAAVAAREDAGIHPAAGLGTRWSHPSVQAQFSGVLINRRKRFPGRLRDVLSDIATVREKADYTRNRVTEREARRVLRLSREFVGTVRDS